MVDKLYENDIYNANLWWRYEIRLQSIRQLFLVKKLIDDEFLISDGIVFHITGPEYDKLFLNKLVLGFGI